MRQSALVLIGCVISMVPFTLFAADDKVGDKLGKAKAAYDASLEKYRVAVGEWFDKREDAARNKGDKKAVDQIKSERQAFDEKGVLPKSAPITLKSQLSTATYSLEAAYKSAVSDYTKLKRDEEAAAIEKELSEFQKGIVPAKPVEAMRKLKSSLENTKWKWPDENVNGGAKKAWFVLNANGSVTAGWHPTAGYWKVVSGTTVEAVIRASDRTPCTLVFDLTAETLSNQTDGSVYKRIKTENDEKGNEESK